MSTATRPDIAAAVGVLSQYMSKPSKDHRMGVKRVLRYLKGTFNYGLKFAVHGEQTELNGYSDAEMLTLVDQHQGRVVESLKSKFSLILFVSKLMIRCSQKQQRKLSKKMLLNKRKETRVKFNPGLSANRPSNN